MRLTHMYCYQGCTMHGINIYAQVTLQHSK